MLGLPATSPALPHPQRRLSILVAGVWAAALTGGVLLALPLLGSRAPDASSSLPAAGLDTAVDGRYAMGDRVPMSFGWASVGGVVETAGTGAASQRALRASLTVMNLSPRPVTYAPGLVSIEGRHAAHALRVVTGSAPGGRIGAMSEHRFVVGFVVHAGAALPDLRLRDPASGRTRSVALGDGRPLPVAVPDIHHGGSDTRRQTGDDR